MSQRHKVQHGTFHVTTNTKNRTTWCTMPSIPEIIIDNLVMTKNLQKTKLHAFCILPDHVHIIVTPGTPGLSAFMHSWKRNTMRDARRIFPNTIVGSQSTVPPPVAEDRIFRVRVRDTRGTYGYSAAEGIGVDMVRWQKSFHDERIRDARQRSAAIGYVQGNGMKHGLVAEQTDWPWTSLHYPHLLDAAEVWLD